MHARPGQNNGILSIPDAAGHPDPDHPVARWQRLLDARLIGNVPPMDPEVLASIRAAEAVVCTRRRGNIW